MFYFPALFLIPLIPNCPTHKEKKMSDAKNIVTIKKQQLPLTKFLYNIYSPVDPRSVPPPSSILDQFGLDFPLELPSATSRLSVDIGEWRLPTNLVSAQLQIF